MLSFKLGAVPAFGGAVAGKIAASAHRQHQASGAGDVRAGARVSAFHPGRVKTRLQCVIDLRKIQMPWKG